MKRPTESSTELAAKSSAESSVTVTPTEPIKASSDLTPFLISFLGPTLMGKFLILYFGLNYSDRPGEGYGVGLALSILFTLSMIGRFLWKNRNYVD